QLAESDPETSKQFFGTEGGSGNVHPESFPLQSANSLCGCLFRHGVGELSQSTVEWSRLDMKDSGQRIRTGRADDVSFFQHGHLALGDREFHAEQTRHADARRSEERGDGDAGRRATRDLGELVDQLVEGRLLLTGQLQNAAVE